MAAEPKDIADHTFRRRALAEAARYGSDPWVFVRELLQNARDAGAGHVRFTVSRDGEHDRVVCRDDGCGMTSEHARCYLFALYASSKDDDRAQAGKFGIGFWAVLRFEPSSVVIRSRAANGAPWQITLDGKLETATVGEAELDRGTEVILERPSGSVDLAEKVFAAAYRYGRFLTRRDAPDKPLQMRVGSRVVGAELALPSPSAEFRGKGFRGVVGLGAEPKVELFAQGLFVRSAASLQDLQEAGELRDRETTEDALAELPSLAPRVLIDSAELDLLLARGDARYDKHLRRVLRAAEKQLGRLIERQLQALRPQPWYRPLLGALRDRLEPLWGWQLATATAVGIVLGASSFWWLPSERWVSAASSKVAVGAGPRDLVPGLTETDLSRLDLEDRAPFLRARSADSVGGAFDVGFDLSNPESQARGRVNKSASPRSGAAAGLSFHQYFDLAGSYSGPRPGSLEGDRSRLAMVYEPAEAMPFFNALVVNELGRQRWVSSAGAGELSRYPEGSCTSGCLTVSLLVSGEERPIRIPVATGHRLEPASVRLDGAAVPVFENSQGEAVVRRPVRGSKVLTYRSGPAPRVRSTKAPTVPVVAPSELRTVAEVLRSLPVAQRVQAGLDYVADRIRYDRSAAVGRSYARFMESGSSLVEAALAVGSGDCDVQNGVLVTLLRLADVEARLVLGYVGDRGNVAPGLHAWVEYGDETGGWWVADTSLSSDPELPGTQPQLAEVSPGQAGDVQLPEGRASDLAPGPEIADRRIFLVTLALLTALVVAVMFRRRRHVAAAGLGASEDLAALLGGALRHPEAFAGLPAMFHGRFVPLLGDGKAISLHQARKLGSQNHLFRSSLGSLLARRAAERGVPVVDSRAAEGRVLSLALGAIDLDHWSNLLDRAAESELCRYVNRHLDSVAAPWRLREVPDLPEPWVEIALEDLRLGQRLILFDLSHLEFAPVRSLLANRPAAAIFTLLDVLLHRLDLPERERARVLAAVARSAVGEAAGLEAATA